MKKTKLNSLHSELGAKLVNFAGFEMPIHYKSLKEEVIAVRNGCGVFDVSHMGEFFVTGNEAHKFVDYIMTNDFLSSPEGKAVYSPMCDDKGMMLDDLIAYKLSKNEAMICVNASNIDKDFNWMKSHITGFDANIDDQSDSFSLLAIQGPKSESVLNSIYDSFGVPQMEYYGVKEIKHNDGRVIIARTGYTGEDGFEVFGQHDFIIDLWEKLISSKGVSPCGLGARDVLRLEVAYPLYGHELDDTVTPLDCGLKWCTKLEAGDFIGKEALQNYQPRFQTVKLVMLKGIARENYKVLDQDQKEIGYITSGTMSVSNSQGIALARINKEKVNTTTDFYVNIRNKNYKATRVMKAFVVGGHK